MYDSAHIRSLRNQRSDSRKISQKLYVIEKGTTKNFSSRFTAGPNLVEDLF